MWAVGQGKLSLDRWLICSQWAGRWAGSAGVVGDYTKALHEECLACRGLNLEAAHELLSQRFQTFSKPMWRTTWARRRRAQIDD